MDIIKTSDLKKSYILGKVQVKALNGVDVSIHEGEFIAIMGPSGCGKSTFLNMIGMLDTPTSGEVYIEDNNVTKMSSNSRAGYRLKYIGFIFQFFNLFNELTAIENIMFPMMLNRMPDSRKKAEGLLNLVGLGDRLRHLPSELSGGQQQRVTIARSLANSPKILLADEPTGNLDTKSSKEIIELFRKLNLERGQTIVMVTHSQEIGEKADRIIRFRDGMIEK
ncbi:MAG: ABC transporter ATP-binding protein [Candidatus Methanoperedens sp.]|nr:ABC transporter ATP-binding protein [Candidatus Methanoperedens sp.]CAG1009773.1 putative ABC transporter ATP-binding protein YknY [Methanosarcinales archaeon]